MDALHAHSLAQNFSWRIVPFLPKRRPAIHHCGCCDAASQILHRRLDTSCFSVGKMLRSNKRGADLTRSSKRNERTDDVTRSSAKKNRICNEGEPTELLISGDLHRNINQGVPVELSEQVASNLSKSVVSIALFDGQTVLFAGSGIPVECLGNVTRFVTSARLAKAFNDKKKDHDDLKVLVRHESRHWVFG